MPIVDRLGSARRRFYAALVARQAQDHDPHVEAAFATVPREHFLGSGPWWTSTGGPVPGYLPTPDDDPVWLCQDLVFALDRERRIHNGQPSLHARCLSHLAVRPGQQVVHVGAGSGYYTALLAELAGPDGGVEAYEIDPALAAQARTNLAERWPTVRVHERNGAAANVLPAAAADAIYVNASATGPLPDWLNALRPGGRLVFPLTPTDANGAMLLVTRTAGEHYAARAIMGARFIPAHGAQDPRNSGALAEAFDRAWPHSVRSLRLGTAPDAGTCWVEGAGWWLSTAPS